MTTIIVVVLFVIAGLLLAMWMLPAFREKVATSWGAVGVALAAILAWILSWFAGAPPELPPM